MYTLELLVAYTDKADHDLEFSQINPNLTNTWKDRCWERYCGKISGLCLAIEAAGGEYFN